MLSMEMDRQRTDMEESLGLCMDVCHCPGGSMEHLV